MTKAFASFAPILVGVVVRLVMQPTAWLALTLAHSLARTLFLSPSFFMTLFIQAKNDEVLDLELLDCTKNFKGPARAAAVPSHSCSGLAVALPRERDSCFCLLAAVLEGGPGRQPRHGQPDSDDGSRTLENCIEYVCS